MISERRVVAMQMLAAHRRARLAFHGVSMRTTLREPMVLEVGTPERARIGDILVFHRDGMLVAHRIVGRAAGRFRTAGDAQPWIVEDVDAPAAIGRVVAVWADSSPHARRIDGIAFHLRSWYLGRFHRGRRFTHILRAAWFTVAAAANPRRRRRGMLALLEIVTAAQRRDAERLVRGLKTDAAALERLDARHRCSAFVGEAVRTLGIADRLRPDVAAVVRRARLNALFSASRMNGALAGLMSALRDDGVPFALLKGAARMHFRAPGAAYHRSDDLDVLVPHAQRERAAGALLRHGYRYLYDARALRHYREEHHHLCPMARADRRFPVEIHHALAEPGTLATRLDWETLAAHLLPCTGRDDPPFRLDAVATAMHLAVHGIGLRRLRDVVVLAGLLTALNDRERNELRAWIAGERDDRVRLEACVVLAARIAGVPWPCGDEAERYVDWALRREDAPCALGWRSAAAEAWYAKPGSARRAWRLLADGRCRLPCLNLAARVTARIALGPLAFVYARLMPNGSD